MNSNTEEEAGFYGDDFFDHHIEGSYKSAKKYASCLFEIYQPKSVVDVGCGRGTWLKAFKEAGAENVVGMDGPWNSQQSMVEQYIVFYPFDLNRPIKSPDNQKFDLAISLEVAEHLKESSAISFVRSLTNLADAILFSAAFTAQGGINHINEKPHTYWAETFHLYGFVPFDIFRPNFWGHENIEFWYQQNAFLYVLKGSALHREMIANGLQEISNIAFMDCIHPRLYEEKLHTIRLLEKYKTPSLRDSLKLVRAALLPAIKRRLHALVVRKNGTQ